MKVEIVNTLDRETKERDKIKDKLKVQIWGKMFGTKHPDHVSKEEISNYMKQCENTILQIEVMRDHYPGRKISSLNSDELIDLHVKIGNRRKSDYAQKKYFEDINWDEISEELKDRKLSFDENYHPYQNSKTSKGRINPKSYSERVEVETKGGDEITTSVSEYNERNKGRKEVKSVPRELNLRKSNKMEEFDV